MIDLESYGYEQKDVLIFEAAKEFSKGGFIRRKPTDDENIETLGYVQDCMFNPQSFAEYASYIGAGVSDRWLYSVADDLTSSLVNHVKSVCNEPFAFHAVIGFIAYNLIDWCTCVSSDFDNFIDGYMSAFPPDSRPYPWSDELHTGATCKGGNK